MSVSYEYYQMIGVEIPGDAAAFFQFLETHGYTIYPHEKNRIHEQPDNFQKLVDRLGLEYMELVRLNPESGQDFFLGYNVVSAQTKDTKPLMQKFKGFFPTLKPFYTKFRAMRAF